MATYAWTGPLAFTSSLQNPTVSALATVAMAGTYTLTVTNNGCTSLPATTDVTVNTEPARPGAISGNSPVCQGSSQTYSITAVPNATSYTWNLPAGWAGTSVTNTITYTIGLNPGTISVTANNGCGPGLAQTRLINISPSPTITGTTPGSVCGSGTVTLGATASAGTINWYDVLPEDLASVPVNSFTTPSISLTTTYYVDATNAGCTTGTRSAVIATVNPVPTITGTTPGNRCGTGTVILGATASAGTINWYAAPTGGASLGTGASFTTPGIAVTTTYYVDATNGGCTTATRTAVIATVNTVPTITGTTPAARCGTGTVTLGAAASAGTINWYAAPTGGASLGTGASFTTPSIAVTTTYYVDATSGGCTTATRTAVIATINSAMSITTQPLPQTDCYGNGVDFSVVISGATGVVSYQWQALPPSGSWANATGTYVSGANTSVLTISQIGTLGENVDGTQYRVIITDDCGPITSNPALLTINSITNITPVAGTSTICAGDNFSYSVTVQGLNPTYQWSFDSGSGFVPLSNGPNYSGVTTATLSINNATPAQSGAYRVTVTFATLNQPGNPTCLEPSTTRPRNLVVNAQVTPTFTACCSDMFRWHPFAAADYFSQWHHRYMGSGT